MNDAKQIALLLALDYLAARWFVSWRRRRKERGDGV